MFALLLAVATFAAAGAHQQVERLNRGVVAVRVSESEVFVSWRFLATDPVSTAFHVYRIEGPGPAVRLTGEPLAGPTSFKDANARSPHDLYYYVRAVADGVEGPESDAFKLAVNGPGSYISIPLRIPEGGTAPDGVRYAYEANDASAADLDGDGEYEIILKWEPTNAKDNSQSGFTGNVFLDAYKLNGDFLWRIDLGRNVRAGAHYTQFIAYDLDGDGRAEVAVKTAPGSRDGFGEFVARRAGLFLGTPPDFDPEADHRNSAGYVLTGHEFFTIFDGGSGAELVSAFYMPPRNNDPASADVSAWGDGYGNRVDRFLAAVAYLDGNRPSLLLCRGYYTRAVVAAWNWRDGQISQVWTFDTDAGDAANRTLRGQGNHNLSIADVDGDGRDEIVYGAAVLDDDGRPLYSTGRGHGDALHVSDMIPSRPGLEVFQPHETPSLYGSAALDLRDARTGELICGAPGTGDIGRGVAFDIDPRFPGYEFWGAGPTGGYYSSATCEQISASKPRQMNFGVWWDGDLLRELLDGTTISKWNWANATTSTLLAAEGAASNNGTKATPALSADLLGDWREEVVWRAADNTELRIYSTPVPTAHRMVTLMHDRQYRLAIAWQNAAYNQPPHPGFFLGEGAAPKE